AVVLSAAGIYSVLAYSVSQRTREIGVRRAMGALDGRILNMVLGQGALQLAVGLGAGLLCAIGFARFLSSMLRGVSPFDPPTLLGVALILCMVSLVASLLPALRAMRVTPMVALRHECARRYDTGTVGLLPEGTTPALRAMAVNPIEALRYE